MQAHDRGECRFIQATSHGDADHSSGNEQVHGFGGLAEQQQPGREQDVAAHQHIAATKAIDQSPGDGSDGGGNQQRGRECAEDQ